MSTTPRLDQANEPSPAIDVLALVNHEVQQSAAGLTAVLDAALDKLSTNPCALVEVRRLLIVAHRLIEGNARNVQESADELGAGAHDAAETAFLVRVAGGQQ